MRRKVRHLKESIKTIMEGLNMGFIIPIVISVLVGLDQWVKYLTVAHLKDAPQVQLWPGVFHLTYVENRGAAFGMMQGGQMFFAVITCLVLIGIVWYWRKIPQDKYGIALKVALVLIVSGAIGNLIDRIRLDFVVDMFYFILIDFPVFNIADICVVVGVALMFPIILVSEIAEEKKMKKEVVDGKDNGTNR